MNDILNQFYKKLEEKYSEGNLQAVENFLLQEAKEHYLCCGKTDDVQIAIYNELGAYYQNVGRIDDAIDTFKRTRDFVATLCGSETTEYAIVVNNLAGVYRLGGYKEKALEGYKETLGIYERIIGLDNYLYYSALNNVALLYIENKKYDEARKSLVRVLNSTKDDEELQLEYAISLTNMGTLFSCEGEDDEARDYLQQAIYVYGNLPEEKKYHLAAVYNTMGDLLIKKGDKNAALNAYLKSKLLTAKFSGKTTEYAILCQKIALVAQNVNEKDMARANIDETLDVLNSLGLSEKPIYAETKKLASIICN